METNFNHKRQFSVLLFVLVFGFPLILLLLQSFAFGWQWPGIFPSLLSLKAWQVLFSEQRILSSVGLTCIIGITVVLINFLLGMPAAKALAHYNFCGKSAIEAFFMMPLLVPSLAVAMGINVTMIKIGLANNLVGVISVHLVPTLPYTIKILRSGYENIGIRWEEQAKTLGVPPVKIFLTVWLPLLIPSIRSAAILTFVISLSQYALTALIGGGNVTTLAMLYFPYFESANKSVMACFSVVFALLPVLFLGIFELALRGLGLAIGFPRKFDWRT